MIKTEGKDDKRDGETDGHDGANSRFPSYFANVPNKTLLTKNGSEYLNWRPANLHDSFPVTVSVYTLSRKKFYVNKYNCSQEPRRPPVEFGTCIRAFNTIFSSLLLLNRSNKDLKSFRLYMIHLRN